MINSRRQRWTYSSWILFSVVFGLIPFDIRADEAPTKRTRRPAFGAIKQTVNGVFAKEKGFQRNDIIAASQVKHVLRKLEEIGWKPPHAKEIMKKTPSDSEFIVKLLRSNKGRLLMRKVSGERLIYDRIERTSDLPGGRDLLKLLPKMRDGYKYLKMHPTPGLKNLAQLLPKQANGRTPPGRDFGKPTGRIYTVELLIKALEKSYRWESQQLSKKPEKNTPSKKRRRHQAKTS